jgi:hypothetical protein
LGFICDYIWLYQVDGVFIVRRILRRSSGRQLECVGQAIKSTGQKLPSHGSEDQISLEKVHDMYEMNSNTQH